MDSAGASNLTNIVAILEQEIIDLKNQMKTRNMRTGALGEGEMGMGLDSKIDLLIEEINQLWSFI